MHNRCLISLAVIHTLQGNVDTEHNEKLAALNAGAGKLEYPESAVKVYNTSLPAELERQQSGNSLFCINIAWSHYVTCALSLHSHIFKKHRKSTRRLWPVSSNCVKLPEKEKVFSVLSSLTSRYWWLQCKYSRNIYLYFIYMKMWCALESDLSLRSIRRGWGGLASSYASAVLVMSLCFKYSHYDGRCCPYGELLSWFN